MTARTSGARLVGWAAVAAASVAVLVWSGLLLSAFAVTAVAASAWTVAAAWGATAAPAALPPNDRGGPISAVESDREPGPRIAHLVHEVRQLRGTPGVDTGHLDHLGSAADVRTLGPHRAVAALERAVGR
ncbi:MAG: hypothetical protein ACRCZP_20935 [Phycicoccus sp.]